MKEGEERIRWELEQLRKLGEEQLAIVDRALKALWKHQARSVETGGRQGLP